MLKLLSCCFPKRVSNCSSLSSFQVSAMAFLLPNTNPKTLNPNAKPWEPSSLLRLFYHSQPRLLLPQPLPAAPEFSCHPSLYHPRPFYRCAGLFYYNTELQPQPLYVPSYIIQSNGDCAVTACGAAKASETEGVVKKLEGLEVSDVSVGTEKVVGGGKRVVSARYKRSPRGQSVDCRGKYCGTFWKPKMKLKSDEGVGGIYSTPTDVNDHEILLCGNTTVMIKNIPNKFREKLMRLLDQHCQEENHKAKLSPDPRLSEYDFVYLPMDFKTRCNLGYAFVNFTTEAGALRVFKYLHKYRWGEYETKKICEISCAKIQGKDALVGHFWNSVFPCDTDDYLPVLLSPPRDGSTPRVPPHIVGRRTPSTSKL